MVRNPVIFSGGEEKIGDDIIIFVVIWLRSRFELATEAESIQKFQNILLTFKQKPNPVMVLLFMPR